MQTESKRSLREGCMKKPASCEAAQAFGLSHHPYEIIFDNLLRLSKIVSTESKRSLREGCMKKPASCEAAQAFGLSHHPYEIIFDNLLRLSKIISPSRPT
jgi:hypothetical protein